MIISIGMRTGEYVLDEDLVYDDFSDWWSNMNDIEKVKEYRKYE